MKKFIPFLMLLVSLEGQSQITLDFQSPNFNLVHIALNGSETKYLDASPIYYQNQFSLYNPDGSLYKTIQLPSKPDPSASVVEIDYVTTSLFDRDSTTIEYMVSYNWDSAGIGTYHQVKVVREDGTILLTEMNAEPYYAIPYPVYNTETGTKLMLYYLYANSAYDFYQTKVFNLPGKLPNAAVEEIPGANNSFLLYPNPNSGSFYIKFTGKAGETNTIDLYTGNGKHIDTFKSDNNLIHINKYGLPDGVYFLNNRVSVLRSTTKMVIEK
jgi:hypothetical protein